MNNKVGIIIGRFQTPELTPAHVLLFREALDNHDTVVVFVGVRDTPATDRNPLSFYMRKNIITRQFPTVTVIPLSDCPTDEEWSKNLDRYINTVSSMRGAVIYHGRDSFASHYKGKYELYEVKMPEFTEVSATETRKQIGMTLENHPMFHKGVIHALQNLPPRIYMTVDIALLRNISVMDEEDYEILLGKKAGMTQWILPGGFIDGKEDPMVAAKRELFEETGCIVESCETGDIVNTKLELVGAFIVDDWRTRGETKVSNMTLLYKGYTASREAKANDDLEEVRWFNLQSVKNQMTTLVHPIHHKLIEAI